MNASITDGVNCTQDTQENDTLAAVDKVTQLQDYIDNLALQMFDGLRLLPHDTNDENQENMAKVREIIPCFIQLISTYTFVSLQVHELAKHVADTVKSVDALIDQLPGANKPEEYVYHMKI